MQKRLDSYSEQSQRITASFLIYFLLMWLFFYGIGKGAEQSAYYLFRIAVPSAVYTAVFIFPFYYLERTLFEKFTNN